MSRILTGRGSSLSWSAIAPANAGVTSPLVSIQSFTFSDSEELSEFLDGLARVNSHYKAVRSSSIQIETADVGMAQKLEFGSAFTNLELTVESAVESTGTGTNNNFKITLGRAVLSERSELSHGNENSAPSTVTLTFQLSRAASASADPTVTKAAVSGGGS
jgi:hypothetical protein